ncbi:MAG TPA: ABC transporter permease [Streptosporangiaceae bacterium]|nr:ABC transporter permease [Streptosporangiaceae bacterium]
MNTLVGTGALVKMALRRDRIMLVVWLYALTAFVASTVYGFRGLYPTAAGRVDFVNTAAHNPAFLSLYGQIYGNSLGSLTAWRDATLLSVGAGMLSIFVVVRHTRADEETGRLELIGAAVVGRQAALACALTVAVAANLVIAMIVAAAAIAFGLPAAGSVAFVAGTAGSGLVFAGIAAVAAQLAQTARSARGLAIGVLVLAFLLRAVGDSAGQGGPRWLSWLSPSGWAELDRAFGAIRWWVLTLPVAVALIAGAGGAVLAARRDYDAGLLAQRRGPGVGSASLRSPLALAWRLQRASLLAWAIGALVYGIVIGSSAKGIGGALGSGEVRKIMARLGGQAGLTDAYLAALLSFTGLVAAGYAVSTVLRLRSEETDGHADPVLATGAGRISWGIAHVAIAAGGTAAIMALVGLGTGVGFAYRAGGGSAEVGRLLVAGLAQAPAALVIAGIATALFGLVPRASVAVSWSVLGVTVAMLLLSATLKLSHWVLDVSPFSHLPKLPGGTADPAPFILLCLVAALLAGAGLVGLWRRDIASG